MVRPSAKIGAHGIVRDGNTEDPITGLGSEALMPRLEEISSIVLRYALDLESKEPR